MTPAPALAAVERFAGLRGVVLGDLVADEWVVGTSREVSREAPVPTVVVQHRTVQPGGAGNAAANMAALGAGVDLVAPVGDDPTGMQVRRALRESGVGAAGLVVAAGRCTVAKRRLVADQQVVARFDEGDTAPVGPGDDRALGAALRRRLRGADVLVVADYGLGACDGPHVRAAVRDAVQRGLPVVVDAHDVGRWRPEAVTAVTPNWDEIVHLLARPDLRTVLGPARVACVQQHRAALRGAAGAGTVVATLDADGAVVIEADAARHVPVTRVERAHPAGAGDAFAAALALGLAAGPGLAVAVDLAVAAAGVVVRRAGTAVCSSADLRARLGSPLVDPAELVALLARARSAGATVAFTNGCFDLLHPGHVQVLRTAAELADVVVVGLNSDEGVRRVKGAGRPVTPLADRAAVLSALGPVDHVVAFDGDAPVDLVRLLVPDVFVKGADHDVEALPEARLVRALGGRVHVVPYLPDRSTSGVIAACSEVAV
jgi:rfaE bifunctional protein kinase chain/domain/rfaE bifunctional protein nucleotidyltransferase chain/domain